MNQINDSKLSKNDLAAPIILLVLVFLAHGLLIPSLGYYWDDWPYAWINHMYGPSGYPEFVALDRPYSAWIFMGLTTVLGEQPLGYHITSVALFWLCAVLFWWVLRSLWPQHKKEALWAAMLFVVYPGFLGHPQAIIYNHHFTAMALYLLSFIGMIKAIQAKESHKPFMQMVFWHVPAIAALFISQFSIEYFLGWEAVRLGIAFLVTRAQRLNWRARVKNSVFHALPYWLTSLVFVTWRVFIFQFPTYQPVGSSRAGFVLHEWLLSVLNQFMQAVFVAWKRAFPQLTSGEFGMPFWLGYLALIFFTSIIVFIVLGIYNRISTSANGEYSLPEVDFGKSALLLSTLGIIFAGWPFWLTDLTINIRSPFDSRFTMAFIPWVALLLTAIFHWVSKARVCWLRAISLVLLAFMIGGSTGYHLWNANYYRHEWRITQRYFQQMVHRIPDLEPGTDLVINDLRALSLYQDDSLTAILNWTYAPDKKSQNIDYMVHYLSVRLGYEIPALVPGLPINHTLRSLQFTGSTDQMIVVYYQPPGCLRVLDGSRGYLIPEDFPDPMRPALALSDLSLIKTDTDEHATPPLHLFDEAGTETWCQYFEEADLAAQRGDWVRVAELGDVAFELPDQTNEVTELFVFIEGYLRANRLDQAWAVSQYLQERGGTRYDDAVCNLWRAVEADAAGGLDPGFNLEMVYATFCTTE